MSQKSTQKALKHMDITNTLISLQNDEHQRFMSALIPNIPKESVLGIKTPALRNLAKSLRNTPDAEHFLCQLPHRYFEENQLHDFLLEHIQDFSAALSLVNAFLPYVDNWATCDSLSPKCFRKHHDALLKQIPMWLQSDHTYTIRFGIKCLMNEFLDGDFSADFLDMVSAIRSDEYYVNMMQAWYFATALAKQYDAALPYLTANRLSIWVHNKTIQKAIESNRIPAAHKAFLRGCRRSG